MSTSTSAMLATGERMEWRPLNLSDCLSSARAALDNAVIAYDRLCRHDETTEKSPQLPVLTDSESSVSESGEMPLLDPPDSWDLTSLAGLSLNQKRITAVQLVRRLLVVSPSSDASLALMAWITAFLPEGAAPSVDGDDVDDDTGAVEESQSGSHSPNQVTSASVPASSSDPVSPAAAASTVLATLPTVSTSPAVNTTPAPTGPIAFTAAALPPLLVTPAPRSSVAPPNAAQAPVAFTPLPATAAPASSAAPPRASGLAGPSTLASAPADVSSDEEDFFPFADDEEPDYVGMYGSIAKIPPPPPTLSNADAVFGPCYLVTRGRPLNSTPRGRGYGVYRTWGETSPRVLKVSSASFNRYDTLADAWAAYAIARDNGVLENLP